MNRLPSSRRHLERIGDGRGERVIAGDDILEVGERVALSRKSAVVLSELVLSLQTVDGSPLRSSLSPPTAIMSLPGQKACLVPKRVVR